MSNSANLMSAAMVDNLKLLIPAAMVDNLAEKIDKCSLNQGRYVLFVYNWEHEKCLLYRVPAGSPVFRGF